MRLSKQSIARLSLAKGAREAIFFDDRLPGFGVRLLESGRKSWIVQYRAGSKQRRQSLGNADVVDAETARRKAQEILAQVRLGDDPQKVRRLAQAKARNTLATCIERYLTFRQSQMRPRSFEEVKRHLQKHWRPLHDTPIHEITRAEVASRLTTIAEQNGKVAADRARSSLSALFVWAIRQGFIEANPVANTIRHAGHVERDRVLSDSELAEVWRGTGDDHYGRIVRFLMLTAARREEVASIAWSEVDLKAGSWLLPAVRSKNNRAHQVPLSAAALACLEGVDRIENRDLIFGRGEGGYSGWSRSKGRLDEQILKDRKAVAKRCGQDPEAVQPMPRWTLHDLRRSAATRMAELGVQPHVVEAILNHVSGHKAGVAGVYNRSTYEREKEAALDLWAEHLAAVVDGRTARVVRLRQTS